MTTDGFTKLFSSIITSSIWSEDDKTRILWITILAITDADGFCAASIPGLSAMARMSVESTAAAIKKLESPDPFSRSSADDGRRIAKVEGGWLVINYRHYRDRERAEKRREYMKELMASKRANKANNMLTSANVSASASASSSASASVKGDARGNDDEEKGGCKGGESKEYTPDFLSFWTAYPKKHAKGAAWKAWKKQGRWLPQLPFLLAAIEKQKKGKAWLEQGGKFIPDPATWLNQDRWDDEVFVPTVRRDMI